MTITLISCAGLYVIVFHKDLLISLAMSKTSNGPSPEVEEKTPSPEVEEKTCPTTSVTDLPLANLCPYNTYDNMFVLNDYVYYVNATGVS